jgi:hypothetical protein
MKRGKRLIFSLTLSLMGNYFSLNVLSMVLVRLGHKSSLHDVQKVEGSRRAPESVTTFLWFCRSACSSCWYVVLVG